MSLQELTGQVIGPSDTNYDEARAVYNAMIDKKPAIIVVCENTQDVVNAINYSVKNKLEVSIRGGGHNGAGLGVVDNGLVIDLSGMKTISIDPDTKTAVIGAGNLLREIDAVTHEYGLALPSGIFGTTGISGLTLGGGLGYLSRKAGLTIDNLLECEVVLANGDTVIANKDSHSDLFWALRGGGGNFGVVTSFKFKLIEVKKVYAGPMFWPLEQAKEAMRFYDEFTKNASKELYGFFAFLIVPPADPFPENLWNKNVCGVVWNYTGPIEKAAEVFKPIREFGPHILDFVGEMPMPVLNGMFDALYPPGLNWYWRAHYFKDLPDEAIEVNVKYGGNIPNFHSTTHLYPIDGAVHDVANSETAWANRDARWAQVIAGIDPDPANSKMITDWSKKYHDDLSPFAMGGGYINFLMNEGQERVMAAYKSNYDRLVEVKTKYDPSNFFHINQNIKPI
ncbi:FAD/FMN-containing dehydrogenase [Algoriphagus zhangzhouensis]|uniref:FAD/FMN-containing dehydrogenase n=2 Tax=Algoriphagus zhangzhouensis TaxID=1073327 RepID=A0A1M7Z6G2_9BACT|nr:FAD/FMN-containing dehydrogenase [Algoriphagus zhangzhouensis]SHO60481.1 FAD/FMN-containing dehydrogenase [Algoriphagus zhangzhouensis]